jgi:hypothetical protein
MNNERLLVLDGLAQGRLTVSEAERLLKTTADRTEPMQPSRRGGSSNHVPAFLPPEPPSFLTYETSDKWI